MDQQISSHLYIAIGTLILANLGTVVTVVYGIGRVVWFMAKLDSRVGSLEKDTDAAHSAIRDLKKTIA